MSFYYDEREFGLFLKFFEFLNGLKNFNYDKFLSAYAEFSAFISRQKGKKPDFMKSADEFLQFLYDMNIICFIEEAEDERFIMWCFVERGPSNMSPKVKTGMEYEIHYGLANALNTGKPIKKAQLRSRLVNEILQVGRIKTYLESKNYGFIQQPGLPVDIYFRSTSPLPPEQEAARNHAQDPRKAHRVSARARRYQRAVDTRNAECLRRASIVALLAVTGMLIALYLPLFIN